MSALITVITPTYNRAENLRGLFASLQSQTTSNFEWLVVDDGSVDHTREVVANLTTQAAFPIRYLYQENGGKHTALNRGIPTIDTPLTFIVDSDDTVTPTCMEVIESYYNRYKDDDRIGVLSFLKSSQSHGVSVQMPQDETVGSYAACRVRENRPGDMAEVFWTRALAAFPFPAFAGERFLSEDVVWIPLGQTYQTVFINRVIYLFDYLPDGLTRNDKRHKLASPLGSMLRGRALMHDACGIKANIKGAILYNCYRQAARTANCPLPDEVRVSTAKERVLTALTWLPGRVFYNRWRRHSRS